MINLKICFTSLLLTCSPALTKAQTLAKPQYFNIAGLAKGDVLNVRAEASSRSEDIGDLNLSDGPLEVLETDTSGIWGRILWKGDNAWVSLAYLSPTEPIRLTDTNIPIGIQCAGTEPFWNFRIETQDSVSFRTIDEEYPLTLKIDSIIQSQNSHRFPVALMANAAESDLIALVDSGQCSDDMSDKLYGWKINMLFITSDGKALLSGCCQLPLSAN